MGQITKGVLSESVQYGGRVFRWKSTYRTLDFYANCTTNVRGTGRLPGTTSGYAAPAAGFRVLAMRIAGGSSLAAGTTYNAGLSMSDNDVGLAASTAFTNGVNITSTAINGVGAYYTTTSSGPESTISKHFGAGYTVTSGKYLSGTVTGTASNDVFVEVLIELL